MTEKARRSGGGDQSWCILGEGQETVRAVCEGHDGKCDSHRQLSREDAHLIKRKLNR